MEMVITGGLLVDGTTALPRPADVLVRDDRVAAVSTPGTVASDAPRFDATGMVVCPGFIDIHTHSDLTVLSDPHARSKVHQGVTTEVVGNCGLGSAPLTDEVDVASLREAVAYLDLDPAVQWTWRDVGGYLGTVEAAQPSLNIAALTAHMPLRAGTVGFDDRPATATELETMRGLLADSFAQGSLGLSTGLVYAPLTYAGDDELVALGEVVARHDRVFAWHMRDYSDDVIASLKQVLIVAERTGCRTQISHLTATGRRNHPLLSQALDLIDAVRSRGIEVGVDIYPYLHGNAPLSQQLPAWSQEGGNAAMTARLADPGVQARIRALWQNNAIGWDEFTISRVPESSAYRHAVGRRVTDTAPDDPDGLALALLAESGNSVLIVAGGRSEPNLITTLGHPATVVASDGLCMDPDGITAMGAPHPRSFGCFPRFLSRYAPHDGAGLSRAIRQCTSGPAAIAGLKDRGTVAPGAVADLVVYDPTALADVADFDDPRRLCRGLELVMVGGEATIRSDEHTGARAGRALRRTTT